jgi:hypothetical protein
MVMPVVRGGFENLKALWIAGVRKIAKPIRYVGDSVVYLDVAGNAV